VALWGVPCAHGQNREVLNVTGHNEPGRITKRDGHVRTPGHWGKGARMAAMGIDWMNRDELSEAIPPAYTEHIGRQLIGAIP
jgi:DNA (cytosine-5)-methyltransferase 1